MMWLTLPIAAVAAGVMIPSLIILYFLKLRRRDVEISTTLLWKKTIQDMQANAPFQRLRRNILLLLQLLILIAGLLAVAQPEIRSDEPPPTRSVIVIDRSASMATVDETDEDGNAISRLEKARREALNYVDLMGSGEQRERGNKVREAMVIAFDRNATVVQTFTSDRDRLRRAIEAIEPTDGVSHLAEAIKLANAQEAVVLENVGLVTVPIYMWSDGHIQDLEEVTLVGDTRFEFNSVGRNGTPNVGIVSLQAERDYDSPDEATLFVGLMSTDLESREAFVEVAIDGLRAGAGSVTLPAAAEDGPGYASFVFPLQRTESAVITATVTTEDALMADNTARMILPPAQQVSVGFVTEGHLFLKYALEALRLSRVVQMTPEQFLERAQRGQTSEFDVFILDRWVPEVAPAAPPDLDSAGNEIFDPTLPPGHYLIFNAIPKLRGLFTGEPVREAPYGVLEWRRTDPALDSVSLANLTYWKPASIVATEEVRILADGEHGPLIVEAAHDTVRAITVGFDITETDWYLKPEWVLFLGKVIKELGRGATAGSAEARPGGTLSTRLPAGVTQATLVLPRGDRVTLYPSEAGQVSYGPIDEVGFYRLQWKGPAGSTDVVNGDTVERAIPVNLLDASESSIRVEPQLELNVGIIQAVGAGDGDPRYSTKRLWPWLMVAALVIMMLEWFVYNRKVHL